MKSIQLPTILLSVGIATRCVVYFFLSPYNNDAHITIIEFLVKHGRFPNIMDNYLAFHPPLYYWMAAPILAFSGSHKAVQFLSLIFSIGTLIVLYRIIYETELIARSRARTYCLLLACFLPQFIMFGLYISNDSLSFFLGSLLILELYKYVTRPEWKEATLLAVVIGLGLLTKTSFLAFLPVLLGLVFFIQFREHRSFSKAFWAMGAFLIISGALGSYKYIDNYVRYKNPLMNSLDVPAWSFQTRSYRGVRSYFDFNLERLVAEPSIPFAEVMGWSDSIGVTGSYPLLLYGTFWYQLIPESNFRGAAHKPFSYLGSVIYLVALVPSAVFMLGVLYLTRRLPSFIRTFDRRKLEDRRLVTSYVAAALLAANAALIISALIRYHVWALMQGRYLFPSLAGALVTFAAGAEILETTKYGALVLKSSMIALMVLFGMYFSSEIGYLILHMLSPGVKAQIGNLV